MSAYTEQEELEKLAAWWKEYGNSVIAGILLGVALLAGVRYWTHYQEERREGAAALYEQMLQDLRQHKAEAARGSGAKLLGDYAATPYAGLAALMLARQSIEAGDRPAARAHLQWALEHAADPAIVHAARLRLARMLVDAGELDAAAALANVKETAGFEAEYQELRGDLLAKQGKRAEARAAYAAALKELPSGSPYRPVLAAKLDDLGAEPTP